ncbi:MAG: hypothetical protein A2821_00805 [Candidatus Magasanikbacteria bacterium RIFCSPHIGHO2_01_FULL_41_23]|uniref:Succinylglutamate desuccinylase/Aspartoacylase catalytic domain-containing protein n=1 Tax=Candidatus Magasanikbacteria bacterium RIFCSPLOWO2_01_FULL_40_15 TaxID=1798686 RepID=A0A1F6N0X7_9BACT|nr:MAG: hypothetical protein A2821_00805 [Candidatus Magasanikbacteria bacterium RIFCSPHIGHO2_01_FULL_41_23]OGH74714.1 MAG: hypothetical protein A3F22_02160 [Candidatus Magasanikbacteria bacterium RIFCSPHIGHO2_12_FULL_41_16]OGH77428.1 MAG: hypothetical protein A2983_01860 [Candidatus Magasanikbacteria bacterium RIFCSPLOWO2_01_FULL_40_15]
MVLPTHQQFLKKIHNALDNHTDVRMEKVGELNYKNLCEEKKYDYVKISSAPVLLTEKILLIRAGIHGNETAGVLTLMKHIGQIFDYAHERGVKLIVFPLDNPSGFEARTRYNIEGDRGDAGNNDFVRYILADGTMTDDLGSKNEFKEWKWSSDSMFRFHLPQETTLLHTELKKLPLSQIVGVIDLHGDNFINRPYAYHYAYGDVARYHVIVEKIREIVPILANEYVNSGYLNGSDFVPEVVRDGQIVLDDPDLKSDADGFIIRYEGSFPDLLHRLGAEHAITVETTGVVSEQVADEVNLIWIFGLIDLIAQGK